MLPSIPFMRAVIAVALYLVTGGCGSNAAESRETSAGAGGTVAVVGAGEAGGALSSGGGGGNPPLHGMGGAGAPGAGTSMGDAGGTVELGGTDAGGTPGAGDNTSTAGAGAGTAGQAQGGAPTSGVRVVTCEDLKTKLEDVTTRVVELADGSVLDCRTSPKTIQACELQCTKDAAQPVFWRVPVGEQTCTTLADTNGDGSLDLPAGKLVSKTRTDFTIKVGSNKTLRGLGAGATLKGVSLDIEDKTDVTIRNIRLTEVNPDLIEAGDGITVNGSKNVLIEHCELSMISDGYIDIRYGSTNVTVSHTHIVGRNPYVCGGQHHYVSLVSDSEATFHHVYFDHSSGRNPKVSDDSRVHLYSNYYEGISYFCSSASAGSELLVEGNFYRDSRYPHWADGGSVEANGNQYAGSTSADHRDDNADVFTPAYEYQLDDVSALPMTVPARAGPRPN